MRELALLRTMRARHLAAPLAQASVDFETDCLRSGIHEHHGGIHAAAGGQERARCDGRGQVVTGWHVTCSDAIAESVLQRHSQKRQRLRTTRRILDACPYYDFARCRT